MRPERQAQVIAVSDMVRRHIQQFHHVPRALIHVVPNAIDPERVKVSQPGAVRCAFRNRLGLEPSDLVGLFVGHNFALKGLKPLLQALGARNSGRSPADSPSGLRRRPRRRLPATGQVARDRRETVHFLGFHDDIRECYAVQRLLRLADLLRPVLAGGAGSAGLRATRHHHRPERCQRADHRRPPGLCPDLPRRPGRADRCARPHDRRRAPQGHVGAGRPARQASRPSTATSRPW